MALHNIENLEDLLKGHINGPIIEQTISRLTAPGENFGSLMLRVDVTVKSQDKIETVYTVAKCVPPNPLIQRIFNTPVTFKNEIAWYTTIIPTMQEFQRKRGIETIADFFPKLYGARFSLDTNKTEIDSNAIILLENLAFAGYKNGDRQKGFDLKTSKVIIEKLATFHAVLTAIRQQNPDFFQEKIKQYLYKFPQVESKKDFNPNQKVLEFYRKLPECAHLIQKIESALNQNHMGQGSSGDIREPWATALHSDFWLNNIMIKEEEEGKPPKVIILDLQTCGFGSPVSDLLFFLGISVNNAVAEEHMDDLIKHYYNEFICNLKTLDVENTARFSYKSFLKELEIEGQWQFGHCIYFVLIVLAESAKAEDTATDDFKPDEYLKKMSTELTDKHKEKYLFLAKEFAKRNWI